MDCFLGRIKPPVYPSDLIFIITIKNNKCSTVKMYAGNLYGYTPTLAGGVIFTLLFLATTGFHIFQLTKARCWYFIPFVIGGICK